MSLNTGAARGELLGSNPELPMERKKLEEKMAGGVKVTMPSTLLRAATRAQNQVVELQRAGGVSEVVKQAVQSFKEELEKLKGACQATEVEDEFQQHAKETWMKKNVAPKEEYLAKLLDALTLDEEDLIEQVAPEDSASNVSGKNSSVSSVALALAEAQAEEQALALQERHLERRQRLEEQERRLREQKEKEELLLRRQQAQLRRAALEKAASGVGQLVTRRARPPQESDVRSMTGPQEAAAPWVEVTPPTPLNPKAPDFMPQPASSDPGACTLGLLQHALLPTSKLPTFKGDPLEFLWFIKAFESQVEVVTRDPVRRLHLLLQHLEGDPHTLVVGCQLEHPEVGYRMAKRTLQDKYGNPIRQALAFKSKLLAWANLKKDCAEDLEKFSVQLQLCQQVKRQGGMADLDAAGTILQLMHKLPMRLQDRWLKVVVDVEGRESREANFEDFTRFVKASSDMLNHPVYGKGRHEGESTKDGRGKVAAKTMSTAAIIAPLDPGSKVSSTTSTPASKASSNQSGSVQHLPKESKAATEPRNAFKAPCLFCEQQHSTAECRKAETMDPETKREKLRGLCFACLKPGHSARTCKQRLECTKCQAKHPTVMHDDQKAKVKTTAKENEAEALEAAVKTCATRGGAKVAVAVVPVDVWQSNRKNSITIHAVLDPGSTATFISTALVQKLGLQSEAVALQLTTMSTEKLAMATSMVAGLNVAARHGQDELPLPPAFTMAKMPFDESDAPSADDLATWKHLRDLPLAWERGTQVDMLIGMNAPAALCPLEVRRGEAGEPYAVRTLLGWCVNGPLAHSKKRMRQLAAGVKAVANFIRVRPSDPTNDIKAHLHEMYYKDFDQAYEFQQRGQSQDDRRWTQIVKGSIQRCPEDKTRYQIALPFKDKHAPLRPNYAQAKARLTSLAKKFRKNKQFQHDYTAFMSKMEQGGYVEEVKEDSLHRNTGDDATETQVFYIPHHGVYHPRKPGKIRVVFNCSDNSSGTSLNSCLLSGPDLTNSLVGVLLRFRLHPVAFTADIESMFYRVIVPKEQRASLRYLWWPGGDPEKEPRIYQLKVHLFGATSSPSCANFALRTAAEDSYRAGEVDQVTVSAVKENFYVDDCLKSMRNEEDAIRMARNLIKACAHGGFKLSKFLSTSVKLLKALPKEALAKECETIDLEDKDPLGTLKERALGVMWNVADDALQMTANESEERNHQASKREVLAKLSSVYDPLGIAAPVIIVARILFRTLNKDTELGWDDAISEKAQASWKRWVSELSQINNVTIPRCYQRPQDQEHNWEVHTFCDASEDAYAAVSYLRCEVNQQAHVTFILGKARVSPPKVVTIPRLELTAAKLATDIATVICKELPVQAQKRVFWSDSQTVLKYLQNTTARFHTFVANRVQAILNASEVKEWRYVPTQCNPADEGSRGLETRRLATSLWLQGPTFLQKTEEHWPPMPEAATCSTSDLEVKAAFVREDKEEAPPLVEMLASRYSNMRRFRRSIGIWLAFKLYLQRRRDQLGMKNVDLKQAEEEGIKSLQEWAFGADLKLLREGKMVKRSSALFKLSPAVDSRGLLVMRSRTRQELPILPASNMAKRLVEEAHEMQAHLGRQTTMAAIMAKYWIIGLNQLVRKTVKGCPMCQRRHAQAGTAKMSDLPPCRLNESSHPFVTTGVDYFGPFHVLDGRKTEKMYGVIFTCTTTRAVHLEASESLTSSSFLNMLRRFIARRGHVQEFLSDNGTNFVGANAELQRELQKEAHSLRSNPAEVENMLKNKGIKWRFNVPTASHHGGVWERLIRSTRRILGALLVEQRPLTKEGLTTLLCETEAILNNRPITTVSDDPMDLEPLTPNHLLLGRAGPVGPPGRFTTATLRNTWRRVQHMTSMFWKRWVQEYKTSLHQRSKWHHDQRNLQIGDIVLLMEPKQPRDHWKLGRVVEVLPGPDGHVRTAVLRTKGGLMKRPITKLCYLEAASLAAQGE